MDPHSQLDYVKMKLREFLLFEGRIKAKTEKSNLYYSNCEIERITQSLDKELSKHNLQACKRHNSDCLNKIDYIKRGS